MPKESKGPAQRLVSVTEERDALRVICKRLAVSLEECLLDARIKRPSHMFTYVPRFLGNPPRPIPKTRAELNDERRYEEARIRHIEARKVLTDAMAIKSVYEHARVKRLARINAEKRASKALR